MAVQKSLDPQVIEGIVPFLNGPHQEQAVKSLLALSLDGHGEQVAAKIREAGLMEPFRQHCQDPRLLTEPHQQQSSATTFRSSMQSVSSQSEPILGG